MPPTPVTVLADAGPTIGLGHLSRAGAVAAALRARGHAVTTHVCSEHPVEHDGVVWAPTGDAPPPGDGPLLVDSYRADVAALAGSRPVAAFWDGVGDPPGDVALAITLSGPEGPRLACLRPMFWGVAPRPVAPEVRRILVATGAGAAGGLSALAATVRGAAPGVEVAALLGPYTDERLPPGVAAVRTPPRMVDELQAADLVVTAAGQTMLETLCAGTPCVALAVVGNQRAQLDVVTRAGAVRAADGATVGATLGALLGDAPARAALARAGRETVDGFGALRVAGLIGQL